MTRTPAHYLHGPGGVVIVPARIAHRLDRLLNLRAVRVAIRGQDPELDAVLVALGTASAAWHAAATGRPPRHPAAPQPQWYSTTQAAERLHLAPRTVRLACETGALTADQVDGRWRITPDNLAHYAAARTARAA